MKITYPGFLCFILMAGGTVAANDQYPNWSVSGFGTFGAAGTDARQLGFVRDKSQAQDTTQSWGMNTDSRLGLQIDVDFSSSLHATAQYVIRDHAGDFFEQNLEWAFLRWSPRSDVDIRVGRMGLDVFLLSEYRNVGFAYTWIRPPHEFYSQLSTQHFDGVDIKKKFFLEDDLLSLKFFAGHAFNQSISSSRNRDR